MKRKTIIFLCVVILLFAAGVKTVSASGYYESGNGFLLGNDCPPGSFVTGITFPRGLQDNFSARWFSLSCAASPTVTSVGTGYRSSYNGAGMGEYYHCDTGIMSGMSFPRGLQDNASASGVSPTCYAATMASRTLSGTYSTDGSSVDSYTCPAGSFFSEIYFPRSLQDNASAQGVSATCVTVCGSGQTLVGGVCTTINEPHGYFDNATCGTNGIYGWVCDNDHGDWSIDIHIYDGPTTAKFEGFIAAITANQARRADADPYCGGTASHGFQYTLPATRNDGGTLRDGKDHNIHIYGINVGPTGVNNPLIGTKTINCPVNGTCAATHYTCATGTGDNQANANGWDTATQWKWNCIGSTNGTNASCSENKPISGTCASKCIDFGYGTNCSSSSYSSLSPLCSTGTLSAQNTYTSYSAWSCTGSGGGSTVAGCSACAPGYKGVGCAAVVAGTCGTASGRTYANGSSSYSPYTQCGNGTASVTSFPTAGNTTSWTCSGTNGGAASGTCSASQDVADSCGTKSSSTPLATEPTTGTAACGHGAYANSPADVATNGSQAWRWSCGTATTCTAPKYGCTTTTDSNYNSTGPNNIYNCANTCANGGTNYPTCTPVAGTCATKCIDFGFGSNNCQTFSSLPSLSSPSLCSKGGPVLASSVGTYASYWAWACPGVNGGMTALGCSACAPGYSGVGCVSATIAELTAAPSTIISVKPTSRSTLTWSSKNNATSCYPSAGEGVGCVSGGECSTGGGFATNGATSGTFSVKPANTSVYEIKCTGPGGDSLAQTTVTVINPTATITASRTRVLSGSTVTLTWGSSQVTSCAVSGPGLSSATQSGSQSVTVSSQATYTITCQTVDSPVSSSVTVNVAPSFNEF